MKKRGMSPIVASVLIIMLTIAAVAAIYSFVLPFVKNSLYGSTACIKYQNYFTFEENMGVTCINGSNIGFSIRAISESSEKKPDGFYVVFENVNEKKKIDILESSLSSAERQGVKLYDGGKLVVPQKGEVISYSFPLNGQNYNYLEVGAILEDGRLCDKNDKIAIVEC